MPASRLRLLRLFPSSLVYARVCVYGAFRKKAQKSRVNELRTSIDAN
jgi:hypothetical protein